MADAHKNFAYSTVATAPSPATSGTSLVVASGEGANFPAVPFNATIWPTGVQPTAANAEIVRVTNISTDTFTITRTQESSSARTVVVGDQIAATITAKTLTDVESSVAMVLITDTLLGADTANFDFTSIPGTYKHLLIIAQLRMTGAVAAGVAQIRMNNDSGGNYDYQYVYGNNTTAAAAVSGAGSSSSIGDSPGSSATANKASVHEVLIPNYASTTFHKSFVSKEGAFTNTTSAFFAEVVAGQWRDTSAITRITIFPSLGNWLAGSRASLYGIN